MSERPASDRPEGRARLVRLIVAGALVTGSSVLAAILAVAVAFSGYCDEPECSAQPLTSTGDLLGFAFVALVLLAPMVAAARIAVDAEAARALGRWRLGALSVLLLPAYPMVAGVIYRIAGNLGDLSLGLVGGVVLATLLFAIYLGAWSRLAEWVARRT